MFLEGYNLVIVEGRLSGHLIDKRVTFQLETFEYFTKKRLIGTFSVSKF